jgi:hypothetical protein
MKKIKAKIKHFNDRVALWGSGVFGSMWTFWIFACWGLLGMMPFFPTEFKNFVLLVSSAWIQLWALPLIAVGTSLSTRAQAKQSKEDHEMIKAQFEMLKKDLIMEAHNGAEMDYIIDMLERIKVKLDA